jgi:hypothetical protein
MWRSVLLVWTDVSEERIASIFRVEKSVSEEPAWAGGYCSSYGFLKKRWKWWTLCFRILEVTLMNSFHQYTMNHHSANLSSLSYLEVHKKVIEGLLGSIWNKMTQKRGRPSWTDVEDHLKGKLHLIQANDRKETEDFGVCSNRKLKGGRRDTSFYCNTCSRKSRLCPNKCFAIYHAVKCHMEWRE